MDVSREPRFWYSYLTIAFGQRGPPFGEAVLSDCLGVDDEDANTWWCQFTGYYDGVIDEADGQVDEPGLLNIPLERGGRLVVEAHPGDLYVHRLESNDQPSGTIANFGPHWWIPEWSLAGVQELAGDNPFAFLVLSPLVRLGEGNDRGAAEELFRAACIRSGVVEPAAATRLAVEWCRCVTRDV
jgi:hypothetical protein